MEIQSLTLGDKLAEKLLYAKALEKWGLEAQVLMLVEECLELALAAMQYTRKKVNREALLDEMADVLIMIGQMQVAFHVYDAELEGKRHEKLLRLANLLTGAEDEPRGS